MSTNAINWFEIPVTDMDRALAFYNKILAAQMTSMETMGMVYASLPHEEGVGGGLVKADGYVPSQQGVVVYLNGGDDLDVVLQRVDAAGGKVLMPKTSIGENGFMAFFQDSEGNRIGIHSMS